MIMRLRLAIIKAACGSLLPRGLWVGKHLGTYTCEYSIVFGQVDSRGVLQGVSEQQVAQEKKWPRRDRRMRNESGQRGDNGNNRRVATD